MTCQLWVYECMCTEYELVAVADYNDREHIQNLCKWLGILINANRSTKLSKRLFNVPLLSNQLKQFSISYDYEYYYKKIAQTSLCK